MIRSTVVDWPLAAVVRRVVVRGGPAARRASRRAYRLAGRRLDTDLDLAPLAPFRTVAFGEAGGREAGLERSGDPNGGEVVYRGPGWVGGGLREVECCAGLTGSHLRIRDVGLISIARDGGSIDVGELEPECHEEELAAAVLGPALALALARQDVWCLHASAVEIDGRAVLFLGRSGAGKSTLARRLVADGAVNRRLADDVVPVTVAGGTLSCMPHFPQLKLGAADQAGPDVPEHMPVGAIYCLEEAGDECEARVEKLSARAAVGTLIRRTVAARLFDTKLLERHLAFCAAAVAAVPVRRVVYPLRPQSVKQIEHLLAAHRNGA